MSVVQGFKLSTAKNFVTTSRRYKPAGDDKGQWLITNWFLSGIKSNEQQTQHKILPCAVLILTSRASYAIRENAMTSATGSPGDELGQVPLLTSKFA